MINGAATLHYQLGFVNIPPTFWPKNSNCSIFDDAVSGKLKKSDFWDENAMHQKSGLTLNLALK